VACIQGNFCPGECTFYEYLGVIAFRDADLIPGDNNVTLGKTFDNWTDENRKEPPCSELGHISVKGDVRGFIDNNLDKYNEVTKNGKQNGWTKEGDIECGCKGDATTKIGTYRLDPPSWWDKAEYRGNDSLDIIYNCCTPNARNTAVIQSNSLPQQILKPCAETQMSPID